MEMHQHQISMFLKEKFSMISNKSKLKILISIVIILIILLVGLIYLINFKKTQIKNVVVCGDKVCSEIEMKNNTCSVDCNANQILPKTLSQIQQKCGDGICDSIENDDPKLCPNDCSANSLPAKNSEDLLENVKAIDTTEKNKKEDVAITREETISVSTNPETVKSSSNSASSKNDNDKIEKSADNTLNFSCGNGVCEGTETYQTCSSDCQKTITCEGADCCIDSTWSQDPSTVCAGIIFTQTSNCNRTKSATGTKTDGDCCIDSTWTPNVDPATVCTGILIDETSNCGRLGTTWGTAVSKYEWAPDSSTVCFNTQFTQSNGCITQAVAGTKNCDNGCAANTCSVTTCHNGITDVQGTKTDGDCCIDSTWSQDPSTVCAGTIFTQTSNCNRTKSATGTKTDGTDCGAMPYYFIAIHNEPLPDLSRADMPTIEESYVTLKRIIAKADEYGIRLTLMFTAQWSDYIEASPERIADLVSWKKSGHEVAAHHHGLNHSLWDGYTNKSSEEASVERAKMRKKENYIGNIDLYVQKLSNLNQGIESGCMSGDMDIDNMPSEIIYTTCTGQPTNNEVKVPYTDGDALMGKSDFMLSYDLNGVTRYGISHAQVTNKDKLTEAENIFSSMQSGVYGTVAHSIENNNATGDHEEAQTMIDYLTFIHSKDPTGAKNKTVSEIIEQKILPEKKIEVRSGVTRSVCGDGICGPVEKANAQLCPKDCKATTETRSIFSTLMDKVATFFGGKTESITPVVPAEITITSTAVMSTPGPTTGILGGIVDKGVEFLTRKCGDNVCSDREKANPTLCPKDCGVSGNQLLINSLMLTQNKCGDGICDDKERADIGLCQKDCGGKEQANSISKSSTPKTSITTRMGQFFNNTLEGFRAKCGDGVCGPIEREKGFCPKDCGDGAVSAPSPVYSAPVQSQSIQGVCGDGICGPLEKNNPGICPRDCGEGMSDVLPTQPVNAGGVCGDRICDDKEKLDIKLCPKDCGANANRALPKNPAMIKNACGDGICGPLEKANPSVCPGDCR